jgi:hypothetical protein
MSQNKIYRCFIYNVSINLGYIYGKIKKKSYFQSIQPRYEKASKAQKKIILDEFCENCKYNRKYAIRLPDSKIYKRRKMESAKKWQKKHIQ